MRASASQLDNGHVLVAYTAGRMKKNRIKTLAGDRVTVEVSPYDLEKGRLIFRHKDERAGSVNRPAAAQSIPPAVTSMPDDVQERERHRGKPRRGDADLHLQIRYKSRLRARSAAIWPALSCRASSVHGTRSAPSRPTRTRHTNYARGTIELAIKDKGFPALAHEQEDRRRRSDAIIDRRTRPQRASMQKEYPR